MFDVSQQINAVRRQVGDRALEAGMARTVTVSQSYATDIDDLWDAVTSAERIPRWFLPVEGELKVGGRYQLVGNAGGTVQRCDPPRGFDATWEFGGSISWIEVRLTPEGDGHTRFELAHIVHVDDHWNQFGPGAVGIGWDLAIMGLARYFGPDALSPAEGPAWVASEEGRQFMLSSSQEWLAAHIASGEDPDTAKGQAERVIAAYTGTPSN